MSPKVSSRQLAHQALLQLPFLLWLVVVWLALWRQFTPLAVLSGIIVALVVQRVFYLPPAEHSDRFNPFRFVILVGVFAYDLVRSAFEVAWFSIRPRPISVSSIIQVDLRTRSDLIMTLTSLAITMIPGSFVIEVDRPNTILYLHVLDLTQPDDLERMRRTVLAQEERIIRALGSRDDMARLARWHEDQTETTAGARTRIRPSRGAQ